MTAACYYSYYSYYLDHCYYVSINVFFWLNGYFHIGFQTLLQFLIVLISADGPPEVIPSCNTSSKGYSGSKRLRVEIEVEVEVDQFIFSFSFISILSWSWLAPDAPGTQPSARKYPKRYECLEHPIQINDSIRLECEAPLCWNTLMRHVPKNN